MLQENTESAKRGLDAYNRRDVEVLRALTDRIFLMLLRSLPQLRGNTFPELASGG